MRIRSFNNELKIATAMIIDVFNNIIIDRRDRKGNVQKLIKVPCVYGSRTRILKSSENRNKTIKPPITSISITSITRDESRVHSVNDEIKSNIEGKEDVRNKTGIPVSIGYRLSILTKFQEDMDQIVSNFVPFMNPDIYIVWPHPNGIGNIKSQVIFENDISITYPEEIAETEPWRVVGEVSFVLKTWMFAGLGGDIPEFGLIKQINLCDNLLIDENGNVQPGSFLNKFYDVPSFMSLDEYQENVEAGLISAPNFDFLQLSAGLSGCWQDVYGILSGTVFNPKVSGDILTLIENVNNPNLVLTTEGGLLHEGMQALDFLEIWTRMLSGDLSACFGLNDFDLNVASGAVIKCSSCPIEDQDQLKDIYHVCTDLFTSGGVDFVVKGVLSSSIDCTWTGNITGIPEDASQNIAFGDGALTFIKDPTEIVTAGNKWELELFGTSGFTFTGGANPCDPVGIFSKNGENITISTNEILCFCIKLLEDGEFRIFFDDIVKILELCK